MEDKIPLDDKEKINKQKNEKLTCLVFIMHFVCWSRSHEQAPSNRHSEHIISEAGQRIKIKPSYESEDLWIRSLHRDKLQPEFFSSFLFSIRLFIGHWLARCRAVPTDMKGKKKKKKKQGEQSLLPLGINFVKTVFLVYSCRHSSLICTLQYRLYCWDPPFGVVNDKKQD